MTACKIEENRIGKPLAEALLAWYHANARVLPWREDPTPYHVWVSEIMLQQTRVEAVRPYYVRFLTRLPDVEALSVCPQDELLKLWEGLGYYSRVRNLQKAARIVMDQYGGKLPKERDALLKLPGIGSYTAGAILSIAYGIPAPAVDGNVLRVLSRVFGSREDITLQGCKNRFEALVMELIPDEQPGAFNQALMDLGARVCLPNGRPICEECPLSGMCEAGRDRSWDVIPVRSPKKPRKVEKKTVLLIRDQEHLVLDRRPDKGLLAGLYELPNVPGELTAQEALEHVNARGLKPIRIQALSGAKHLFTHVEWQMTGYEILVEDSSWSAASIEQPSSREEEDRKTPGVWFLTRPGTAEAEYSIPSAFSAYLPGRRETDPSRRQKTTDWRERK